MQGTESIRVGSNRFLKMKNYFNDVDVLGVRESPGWIMRMLYAVDVMDVMGRRVSGIGVRLFYNQSLWRPAARPLAMRSMKTVPVKLEN